MSFAHAFPISQAAPETRASAVFESIGQCIGFGFTNNATANYFMGITLQNKGDKFGAWPYLEKAAALEPSFYKK